METDSNQITKHNTEGMDLDVVYEDNHLLIVNKRAGDIVQGDKTGDTPLSEYVKDYLRVKYSKPGNVFCGVVHRIDRPVSGLVIFARTSKALERLNRMLREGQIHKTYLALVEGHPALPEGTLENYLRSDGRLNKTFVCGKNDPDAKLSKLKYRTVATGDRYTLLEVNLLTGRKHQIRAQLSAMGNPIKGDLKYGARRSNRNGGISLQSARIRFVHPVSKQEIDVQAPPLEDFIPLFS